MLAIQISRAGLSWALENACLSHFDPDVHGSQGDWERSKKASPVRVQWDPERSVTLEKLPYRSIQIGLTGEAALRYAREWIFKIEDITPLAITVRDLVAAGRLDAARSGLPAERPYPLSSSITERIGAS